MGGMDQQYVVNDGGIFVSKIKEDGAAALDGRLQEGDKILSVRNYFNEELYNVEDCTSFQCYPITFENFELGGPLTENETEDSVE